MRLCSDKKARAGDGGRHGRCEQPTYITFIFLPSHARTKSTMQRVGRGIGYTLSAGEASRSCLLVDRWSRWTELQL